MEENKTDVKMISDSSAVVYDNRRKQATNTIQNVREIKEGDQLMATMTQTTEIVYEEGGIKKAVSAHQQEISGFEKSISQIKKALEELKDLESDEEVKKFMELNEKVKKLQQKEQLEKSLVDQETNLKTTKKNLNDIREAVGSALNL